MRKLLVFLIALTIVVSAFTQSKPGIDKSVRLSVGTASVSFDSQGGTKTVSVNSNVNWNVKSNQSFCKVSKMGSQSISISCAENDTPYDRSCIVKVSSDNKAKQVNITVNQSGGSSNKTNTPSNGKSKLNISQESLNFGYGESSQTITVSSTMNWTLTATSSSQFKVQRSGNKLTITCFENTKPNPREDYFYVALSSGSERKKIMVHQSGNPNYETTTLSVSNETIRFSSSKSSKDISVWANANWHLESTTSSIFSLSKKGNTIEVTCLDNYNNNQRQDYFYVVTDDKKQKIKVLVIQDGLPTYLSSTTNNLNFSSGSETKVITINSNKQWHVVTLNNEMFHVKVIGNLVYITCNRNKSEARRMKYLEIKTDDNVKSLSIAIHQQGRENKFNESKTSDRWSFATTYTPDLSRRDDVLFDQKPGYGFGFRYEPQFGWGFGMDLGATIQGFYQSSPHLLDNSQMAHYLEKMMFSIPLRLEYRANFSRWFNIFVSSGIGLNFVVDRESNWNQPLTFDMSAGFRIDRVQARMERRYRLDNRSTDYLFGLDFLFPSSDTRQNRDHPAFNNPENEESWGLSLSYHSFVNGVYAASFGFKYEPLFNHGWGLNTGLYVMQCIEPSPDSNGLMMISNQLYRYGDIGLTIPLHLEYRLNFSRWFNVFAYGGFELMFQRLNPGSWSYPLIAEYGIGMRIDRYQLRYCRSNYIGTINKPGTDLIPFAYKLSLEWMF